MNPTTSPPPSYPGGLKRPSHARPAPPDPEAQSLALAMREVVSAAVEILVTIYNVGGDPAGEREDAIMFENQGLSQEQINRIIQSDQILFELRSRGVTRRK
ncbi:hypothetical protein ONS95_002309 [Cadophora gregata]|uniref:uncharacterized protein n=1 Tax=Cadophora gregata TaxID=51156 RepID=UPI0026DC175E|nr:uncharacterized protein ONS95_002309 [Cadophora gregata]KAK0109628.1 hypothetical protein ONS95_002309 [Cadophora gregata]KAK0110742.1 hypothetical protein ONS96_002341 [Cadophora gregata f. sp. sojae]